jgi:hypothetical protein
VESIEHFQQRRLRPGCPHYLYGRILREGTEPNWLFLRRDERQHLAGSRPMPLFQIADIYAI